MPQIAEILKVNINTLRYRLKPYSDFIPSEQTSKGVEYNDEAEGIIGVINSACNDKKSQEEIMQLLSDKYARDIETVSADPTTTTTTNQQQLFLEQITRQNNNTELLIELIKEQQEQYNKNMQDQMNDMRVAIGELSRVEKHKDKNVWQKIKEIFE